MNYPGLFFSLDGMDGAGKSTQCGRLVAHLQRAGRQVIACTDPGGTALGQTLRQVVLHDRRAMALECEAFLFMASRAQLVAEVIEPALARGDTVVCDRFLLANVVYQGHAGGLDPEVLWQVGQLATRGVQPNLTLLLDLPAEVSLARRTGPPDRLEQRSLAFFQRVRAGFLNEARRDPAHIRVIDATQPVEAVHQQVCDALEDLLDKPPPAK